MQLAPSLRAAMHMHMAGGRLGHGRGGGGASSLLSSARLNPTALQLAMLDRDFTSNDYDLLLRLDAENAAQTFTGVPASVIDRLPCYAVPKPSSGASKDNACAVCLEDRVEGEMVRTLMCLHTFHKGTSNAMRRDNRRTASERDVCDSVFAEAATVPSIGPDPPLRAHIRTLTPAHSPSFFLVLLLAGCIDTWLRAHSTCPICQFKVQLPD